MNIHISCSSFNTYQNQIILCTRISPDKTWLSLSEILLLWQHCRFQALFKDLKECSVITSSHIIFKQLCYQLVLNMNANSKSTHNVNFCLWQKNIWSIIVLNKRCLEPIVLPWQQFLYMVNLAYIVPLSVQNFIRFW